MEKRGWQYWKIKAYLPPPACDPQVHVGILKNHWNAIESRIYKNDKHRFNVLFFAQIVVFMVIWHMDAKKPNAGVYNKPHW